MTNQSPASIPATESRVMHSVLANADYLISVALPFHYENRRERVWPVIYVLDGNWHFNMVVDMVRFMNIRIGFCDELPDALVVGIGYPVAGTLIDMLHQVMHLRMRDFVLSREQSGENFMQEHFPIATPIPSGNGLPFMEFLRRELIPFIEENFGGDPADRTLLGHSLGGNFALYTLFNQPHTFRRYVVASFDPLLNHEEEFAAKNADLAVRMHMVFEGLTEEDLIPPRALIDRLVSRAYASLDLTHDAVSTTHCAMVPYAYQSGLVQVFS